MPKISIVTAYYNRKDLFYLTLKSIAKSKYKDFEVIAVDDGSVSKERIEDLMKEFPFLKVIRIEPKDKWYINPCIPFNMGIAEAKGYIIVLQNPECVHVGDVLSYIVKNLTDDNFISISAYAIDRMKTEALKHVPIGSLRMWFSGLPQKRFEAGMGWYNHPKYRDVYYHFCSAITKKNMDLLGGFDERFAGGIARDDVEFIDRVGRLGLTKTIPLEVSVIHQWHTKVRHYSETTYSGAFERNKAIYRLLTAKETSIYKENSYVAK